MIAPIPTRFDGVLYRSRTEARWAVLLSGAGREFTYEAEGFSLPSGWYLPDFWLPQEQRWLEIKGVEASVLERQKCQELANLTDRDVMLAVGAPTTWPLAVEEFGAGWTETIESYFGYDWASAGLISRARDERFQQRSAFTS